jgi:hypothetical protein
VISQDKSLKRLFPKKALTYNWKRYLTNRCINLNKEIQYGKTKQSNVIPPKVPNSSATYPKDIEVKEILDKKFKRNDFCKVSKF